MSRATIVFEDTETGIEVSCTFDPAPTEEDMNDDSPVPLSAYYAALCLKYISEVSEELSE